MKKFLIKLTFIFVILLINSCTIYVERSAESSNSSISSISSVIESNSSDISSYVSTSDVRIDYNGVYTSKGDVSLYLYTYHELPKNFITKAEARSLGWSSGRLPGWTSQNKLSIGGDVFFNNEKLLPLNKTYQECDIDYNGGSNRGTRRIVWSNDFAIYYTSDHYSSFTRLY